MKKRLGQQESRALAYAQMRSLDRLRQGELVAALQLTPRQEAKLLSRLARAGMIARVRRGLYLVPPKLPLGGEWTPDEVTALNALIEDRQGRYQICGPNAFNRYGFDDQVPGRVYAYNNRLSGERRIGAVQLTLIKVADDRLGGTEESLTPGGQKAVYSSRVRTLVDAVYDWSRFGTLPRAYGWITTELSARRVAAGELIAATLHYGNQGTIRRIGALLEREGASPPQLRKLQRALRSSQSLIAWVPGRSRRGTVDRKWGVVLNG
jgi:predicted transcriptional regulator of viral defense system